MCCSDSLVVAAAELLDCGIICLATTFRGGLRKEITESISVSIDSYSVPVLYQVLRAAREAAVTHSGPRTLPLLTPADEPHLQAVFLAIDHRSLPCDSLEKSHKVLLK